MEKTMNYLVSILWWLVIIAPFSFLFVLFGVISLEVGFGISPPIGLASVCFLLAVIFSIFWRIGTGFKSFLNRFKTKPPKRLLRVQHLQEREQN